MAVAFFVPTMNKPVTYALLVLLLVGMLIATLKAARKKMGSIIKYIVHDLPTNPGKNYDHRSIHQIDLVVVHHSATSSGDPWSYAKYHVEKNDWPGIGYHYVIQPDGTIYQTNDLDTVSYHTSGENANSIGICLTGNFDVQKPSFKQLESLIWLIRDLNQYLGRRLQIQGHNQYSAKSCPGNNIDLAAIRQQVNDLA
jgi:N-acetyl-anhydromuramyl-L-alanine amidase AmpD